MLPSKFGVWILLLVLLGCRGARALPITETRPVETAAIPTPTVVVATRALPTPTVAIAVPTPTRAPTAPSSQNRFGVLISGADVARPEIVNAAKELGVGWVRLNLKLDGHDQDYTLFLAAGINVVLTMANQDPANLDTKYGTLKEWQNAGFPFKSQTTYQQRVRATLEPALPFLAQGRQVWVQAENEISDAAVNPNSVYWRGTTEQYLTQVRALSDAVKALSPTIPVVLSSFASESLDAIGVPNNPRHDFANNHVTALLTQGRYDAVDLHFYGCVEDIPAKVKAIKERMPAGKTFVWISTENGGPDSRCPTTPTTWQQNPTRFEQLQAQQVSARLGACAENGSSICLWFSFFDLRHEVDVFSHLGLLDQSVNPPRKKPAYDAFKNFVAQKK